MAVVPQGPVGPGFNERAGRLIQIGGAAISVALVIGVGVWGWRLMVRDVTGIPVVSAMETPMRLSPTDPGGQVTPHSGLSVNAIAALGEAAPPEDVLYLAPPTAGLAPEDYEVAPMAEAGEMLAADIAAGVVPAGLNPVLTSVLGTEPDLTVAQGLVTALQIAPAATQTTPLSAEQVLAMAAEIAAGAQPLTELAPGTDAPVELSVAGVAIADVTVDAGAAAAVVPDATVGLVPQVAGAAVIAASVPGVAVALRPPVRPRTVAGTLAVGPAAPVSAPASDLAAAAQAISATLPSGTHLVQFGAFASPGAAVEVWVLLTARFPEFLTGRQPVIQAALSGGSRFYRLRTMGFADLAEARRFCVAFVAENQECIYVPVP